MRLIKAKAKEQFTMGGKIYNVGDSDMFTEDQIKRLKHLLDVETESESEQPAISEQPPVDKMVKRGRPKLKNKSEDLKE